MDYRLRILRELGLLDPEVEALQRLDVADFRKVLHRRGRQLLARYHPDRNPDDPAAPELFQVANHVIREVEALESSPPMTVEVSLRVTLYPEQSPSGSHLYTRSVRQGYSTKVESSGLRYDARRVVLIRP